LVAVACGGDDPDPTAAPKPAATTAPAPAATATTAPAPTAAPAATATTAPAPTAMPEEPAGGGDLVIGVPAVCPPIFNNRFLTGACFERVAMWGYTEGLTYMKHAPPPIQVDEEDASKSMVESWEWDENANTLTWVIRTGIPFHNSDFGEVDAEDVAFSFNEAFAEGSTFNRAGQLRQWIDTIEAVDKRTVLINCTDAGCQKDWIRQQSNYNGQTASITSLDAFESLGEEASLGHLENITGAFKATRWVTNEVIESEAVRPHWRWDPLVDTLKFVEIPENSVRMAAFVNGEIHLADLPPRFVAQAVDDSGGRSQQIGGGRGQGILYGGNYWASTDYLGAAGEGNDVTMRPGYKPDDEHPWIGEWGNEESMERGRKIRLAMSLMLDWERLSEKIFGGLADRGWSFYGWTPEHPEWRPEWEFTYDPAMAQQLLEEAGFGDGFSFGYWVTPDVTVVIDPEFGEAMAQMWVDGGLDPKIEKTAYSARRPTLVARSMDIPWAWATSGNTSPKDTNAVGGTVPRAGSWNSGQELPDVIGKLWTVIEEEREPANKRKINADVADFFNKWVMYTPVVNVVPFWAVRPEVTSWDPYTGNLPYFNNPHTIGLK
jgi:ABC-type transport system substrate-binding protein